MRRVCVLAARTIVLVAALCAYVEAQDQPSLGRLVVEGATVYSREDILWLLDLREGAPLRKTPEEIASALQDRYARDGYTEARVSAALEGSQLTLRVDEGRIDDIEILGVDEHQASALRERIGVRPGDVYNKRTIGRAVQQLIDDTQGALRVGRPRNTPATGSQAVPDEIVLERRGGRGVLVVPLHARAGRADLAGSGGREDVFSPVDGFAPAIGVEATIFDHRKFNHTFLEGYVSYRFGPEQVGYAVGGERPLFGAPKLFLGGDVHDITASDDVWRVSPAEQTLVALAFKNTFRDYYRRRGGQLFAVMQAGENNEFTVMTRWDRHEPLANTTDFSLFRGDEEFRPNPPVADQHVNAWILGYTFDTRALSRAGERRTYQRHLRDSAFGFGLRRKPGLRLEWTSELAGRGLGGDAHFDRNIVNLRGYLAFSDRQSFAARGIVGGSDGELPPERRFAIGGIGTVHGYRFKEEAGTGMVLFNSEYRVRLTRSPRGGDEGGVSVFGFYDAGRVTGPLAGATGDWLQGIGFGLGISTFRVEFGYRANDIPSSLQVLVRLGPTF